MPEPRGDPPDEKAQALVKQLALVEEQLEDEHLDPAELKRLEQLEENLHAAIAREPPPIGFARTPAGTLIPEAQWKVMTTPLTQPVPPPYADRERDRLRREIDGDAFAHARTRSRRPDLRRALMLKSRVSLIVERLVDSETPEKLRKELAGAVDRAWLALTNEHATTRAWVDLLECIELVASTGAPPEQVRVCFEREHPEHAASLDLERVRAVLAIWNRPAGRPPTSSAKNPQPGVAEKWKMVCGLAKSAHLAPLGATTLKRLWEEKCPSWLRAVRSKARGTRSGK